MKFLNLILTNFKNLTTKIHYFVKQDRNHTLNSFLNDKLQRATRILENDFALKKSIFENTSVDKFGNPIPWFSYPAIEYLKQLDFSKKTIFEFGAGNSTLFWSNNAKKIISVEDNKKWFNQISKNNKPNIHLVLRESKSEYCNEIFRYNKKFDVIVIDGKYRDICSLNAVKKIKNNGIIILDDSERISAFPDYQIAIKAFKKANLIQIDFCGFNPINDYTKATSFFITRNFNFKALNNWYQPKNIIGQLNG